MDFYHKPKRLLITGRSGSGKTEYFIRYVRAVSCDYQHVFIFDHETEFSQRVGCSTAGSVQELEKIPKIQCYDYAVMYPGSLQVGLEFYSDYVFQVCQRKQRPCLFCVDEFQKLVSTDTMTHELCAIIETGRRYRIDTVFITQQVNLLHNRVRNQVTEVCTFRQNDQRAIQWLVDFGFDEERVRALQNGQFICLRDDGRESSGNIFAGACQLKKDAPGADDAGNPEPEVEKTLDTRQAPALPSRAEDDPQQSPLEE